MIGAEPHVPDTQAKFKMDTPAGLFGGVCSCGWKSGGLQTQPQALKSAQAHAEAKNQAAR